MGAAARLSCRWTQLPMRGLSLSAPLPPLVLPCCFFLEADLLVSEAVMRSGLESGSCCVKWMEQRCGRIDDGARSGGGHCKRREMAGFKQSGFAFSGLNA